MHLTYLGRGLRFGRLVGLGIGLLAGCRSAQPAFLFPTPVATSNQPKSTAPAGPAAAPGQGPAPRLAAPHLPSQPVRGGAVHHAAPRRPVAVPASAALAGARASWPAPAGPRRISRPALRPAARPLDEPEVKHLVLGGLLVIGGILLGLVLGGWLGLGVGVVVVLAGYYFVVLGLGGHHAWREIFQEFFNL